MLAETGHLSGEVPALTIPSSLNALIGARLDALPRARADRAAGLGRRRRVLVRAVAYLEERGTE